MDLWVDYLERVELADHLSYVHSLGALRFDGLKPSLAEWLRSAWTCDDAALYRLVSGDTGLDIEGRLGWATFVRWKNMIEQLLVECSNETLPLSGIVQYFGDALRFQALIEYRRTGSTVDLGEMLVIPDPRAYYDPLIALGHIADDSQLDLLRRSLATRHKVLIQRNTLIHVDREESTDVFGPSIDTLLLNDWLFEQRYLPARAPENYWLFEDPLVKKATEESFIDGAHFLEVGCGNGLLTASFAKNEPRIKRFVAVDRSMAAVHTAYRNSAHQRHVHKGSIGDRGVYVAAAYDPEVLPTDFALIVCNPPYIPVQADSDQAWKRGRLGSATIGTELLTKLVGDAPRLLAAGGELILVASELANPELHSAVPEGWLCTPQRRMRVPFRVEAVQRKGAESYLQWLTTERGLRRDASKSGINYSHEIIIHTIRSAARGK